LFYFGGFDRVRDFLLTGVRLSFVTCSREILKDQEQKSDELRDKIDAENKLKKEEAEKSCEREKAEK